MKDPNNRGFKKLNKVHRVDPRAILFKQYYLDTKSYTFCNITQSALKAGFSETYARNLSSHTNKAKWYIDFTEESEYMRAAMLKKAENRLNERLNEETDTDTGKKLQTDVAKFVSERVGKEFYSTRSEVTGADGKRLFSNEQRAAASIPLSKLFQSPVKSDT